MKEELSKPGRENKPMLRYLGRSCTVISLPLDRKVQVLMTEILEKEFWTKEQLSLGQKCGLELSHRLINV